METKVFLTFPNYENKQAALTYRQEYMDFGETVIHGSGSFIKATDYESWLTKIENAVSAENTGWVNCDTYFAFVDDKIIGTIQIRHTLNDSLIKTGGHIGFGVAPSERRKGYASKMLALALEKCREIGISKVLVTCVKENIGSSKTIIKNGGILENEIVDEDNNIVQRYWITL